MLRTDLSIEQRNRLAQRICDEIDASETAKGTLPDRWKKNEDIYNLVPGTAHMQAVEGMEAYEIALATPKIDAVVGAVTGAITGLYPWVQCLDSGRDGANDEDVEKLLQGVAKSANFERVFTYAVRLACLTNVGAIRICFDEAKAIRNKQAAVMEWIHPSNLVVYPAEFGSFRDAKTIGHRFKKMLYRVKEQMASGEYYPVDLQGGDAARTDYEERGQKFDRTESTPFVAQSDELVDLYEVIHECDLEGEYKKYLCVVAKQSAKLLSCQDYPYSRPNYFEIRMDDSGGRVWPPNCLAQRLQGIQLAYSDTMTLLLQGGFQSAFPLVVMSGGSLPTKSRQYGPATLIESPIDMKVQTVSTSMNPGVLPLVLGKLEEVADSLSRISRLGTTHNLPAGTTATAVNGLLQAQQEAKDNYTEAVSPYVAEMFEFLLELCVAHYEGVYRALGSKVPRVPYAELKSKQFTFEVTGQSGASNPQMLLQKLQFLQGLASQPGSNLDPEKITNRIVQALDLPFDTKGLERDGPSALEMRAMLAGVVSGELDASEVAQLLGGDYGKGSDRHVLQGSGVGTAGAGAGGPEAGAPLEPAVAAAEL